MLNSERKKISLTGCVSYVDDKQDVRLCFKVKKSTAEMPRELRGCMSEGRFLGHLGNYMNPEDFRPVMRTKKNEGGSRGIAKRHAAPSAGLVPDGPGLRGR